MTDPVAARQAAKAAERERLTRERERRESQELSGVTGFVQRKWRWLGVGGSEAVEAVLTMLAEMVAAGGIPEADRAVLARALEGDPDREGLLPATRAGLARTESGGNRSDEVTRLDGESRDASAGFCRPMRTWLRTDHWS